MQIKCISVDDEPPALMQMEDYINRVPYLNLLKTFDNAMECIEFLKHNEVDLMFLDIEMEGFTGIQLLQLIKNKPRVIFTTAYDRYAIQAFELDVSDYLLKPISFERFFKAVEKVYDSMFDQRRPILTPQTETHQNGPTYMFVKSEYRMQRVDFKDILYIEGLKEYVIIKTLQGRVITLQNFKNLEETLPVSNFIRVHKSYMVALDKIEYIERNHIKIGEKLIPVGESYRKQFFDSFKGKKLL